MHISGIFSQCLYLQKQTDNKCSNRAVVVPQLVERSLPTPEVHGSNPVIGKKIHLMFSVNCIEKTKIKKKEAGIGPFFNKCPNKNCRLQDLEATTMPTVPQPFLAMLKFFTKMLW